MVKEKEATVSGSTWVAELFQPGIYKRTQGRVVRQATFGALALILLIGAWRFSELNIESAHWVRYGIPVIVVVVGLWFAYRLVNLSNFADFLIAVEVEMTKVSWPSRDRLIRASIVVIFTIIFLAAMLAMYDLIWMQLLDFLGVTKSGPPGK